jgi:hypothetical protein
MSGGQTSRSCGHTCPDTNQFWQAWAHLHGQVADQHISSISGNKCSGNAIDFVTTYLFRSLYGLIILPGDQVHHQARPGSTGHKVVSLGSEDAEQLPVAKQQPQHATPVIIQGLCPTTSVRHPVSHILDDLQQLTSVQVLPIPGGKVVHKLPQDTALLIDQPKLNDFQQDCIVIALVQLVPVTGLSETAHNPVRHYMSDELQLNTHVCHGALHIAADVALQAITQIDRCHLPLVSWCGSELLTHEASTLATEPTLDHAHLEKTEMVLDYPAS